MFKNKSANGRCNVCGGSIAVLRRQRKLSQRALADQMQLLGIDLSKNAIQQIESGERFVIDLELKGFAKFFGVTADELLK
ncbi:MAG: helix-turn-helix transcriptional regulator [Clostridiales bacterium]|nr:helix-turn-helix transcriptional regulator [Clostridiales bacterium]